MSRLTLTNPSELRALLAQFDVDLKHSLGQNFLISKPIIDKIVSLADCNCEDNVLEVGPGAGTLTVAMLERGAKVASIEKDKSLYQVLKHTTSPWAQNFSLIEGDALEIDEQALVTQPNKFIANLPYNIAATLILDYLKNIASLKSSTVMVQKEVADRICAKPGTKLYGAYTVKLSLFASVTGSFFVGRNNFLPAPRVDSKVVRLDRIDEKKDRPLQTACKIADSLFYNRRKTVLNSAIAYFGKEHAKELREWLVRCGVDEHVRAETLQSGVFETLAINAPSFMA